MQNQIVTFNNHNVDLISHNGQLYMSGSQIGAALEYEDAAKAVHNIFTNHKEEFGEDMSCTLKTRVNGVNRLSRVYNREGAWLIGMFARTPKSAEFRKWVLKVLGTVVDSRVKPENDRSVIVSEHTRALPSGKKEIVLSAKAKEEIGGIVKAVVKAEINNLLPLVPAGAAEGFEVTDQDLLMQLYRWNATRNWKNTLVCRELSAENNKLKERLLQIKKAIQP